MKIKLADLDRTLKYFLTTIISVLTIGVSIGLIYLFTTTNYSAAGTVQRFSGSQINQNEVAFEIPEYYPKPVSEILVTTHNHILGFSFIFFILGMIFYFNSVITGFWKSFLLIEPVISVLITFGSIWLMRFVDTSFVYLTIVSSTIIYLSFFIMAATCIFELRFKKSITA